MAQHILRYFAKETWRFKKSVVAIFLLVPVTIVLQRYIAPLFIAYILLHIQTGDITLQSSLWFLIGFVAIELVTHVFAERFILWLMWGVQIKGQARLYNDAYAKLSRHSLAFYANTFTGSLVSKVNRFTSAYMDFVNTATYNVLYLVTMVLATIIGLSFFIWPFALFLLGLVIIFVIVAFVGTRFMRARFKARSEAYSEVSGKLSDSLSNMLAVKTDAREPSERTLLGISVDNIVEKEMLTRQSMIRVTTAYSFIIMLMRTSALVASVWSIQFGIGNAAVIYICLTYTFNLIEQLGSVTAILRSYYQITGDSAETLEIIEQEPDVKDRSNRRLTVKTPTIDFDGIAFAHHDESAPANERLFADFNLRIKRNQKVGLVGVSGSGKSTLLKLLMRFYDVDEGRILIDGQDISKVTQESLHQHIAYVPQEPLLFHRSIRENIAYARPDASLEEVKQAAAQANALEFIEKLPDGFETLVGERGIKLSGGQRQRIAIARAILKDAPILILDEATAALDSESELLIQEALEKLMKNRTSVVIAHRLSTIAKLDRIVVLSDGEVIEDGSHTDLLARKGTYAKLWSHQSGGFIEE